MADVSQDQGGSTPRRPVLRPFSGQRSQGQGGLKPLGARRPAIASFAPPVEVAASEPSASVATSAIDVAADLGFESQAPALAAQPSTSAVEVIELSSAIDTPDAVETASIFPESGAEWRTDDEAPAGPVMAAESAELASAPELLPEATVAEALADASAWDAHLASDTEPSVADFVNAADAVEIVDSADVVDAADGVDLAPSLESPLAADARGLDLRQDEAVETSVSDEPFAAAEPFAVAEPLAVAELLAVAEPLAVEEEPLEAPELLAAAATEPLASALTDEVDESISPVDAANDVDVVSEAVEVQAPEAVTESSAESALDASDEDVPVAVQPPEQPTLLLDAELASFRLTPHEVLQVPAPIPGLDSMLQSDDVIDSVAELVAAEGAEAGVEGAGDQWSDEPTDTDTTIAVAVQEAPADEHPFMASPIEATRSDDVVMSRAAMPAVESVDLLAERDAQLQDFVARSASQAHVLETLEAVARLVRAGEIVPAAPAGSTPEAVLASVLTSLLTARP